MEHLVAALGETLSVLAQQKRDTPEEATVCFSVLPVLLAAALFGLRSLRLRLAARRATARVGRPR
jgi:hypothetical protein